jgi:hypothetical protein
VKLNISILARILSYYFPKLECITIHTFDTDCYNCIYGADDKFNNDNNFKNRDFASITFKSNDVIIYELIQKEFCTIEYMRSIINQVRNPRTLRYSRKKTDDSIEYKKLMIDNLTFINMIFDKDIHIIF